MHSSEFLARKFLFQAFQIAQGHDVVSIRHVELYVIFHALDKEYVLERNSGVFAFVLHHYKAIALDGVVGIVLHIMVEYLLACLHEVFVLDRLDQIVEGVHLVCFDGVLLESCCEDNLHVHRHELGKLESADLLHVDGKKQNVKMVMVDSVNSLDGVMVRTDKVKGWCLLNIMLQQSQSLRIFIYDSAV